MNASARKPRPHLLIFESEKSGRCRRADGFLAHVLQERRNHETFSIHRVDCDRRPELAKRFHVSQLPTYMVVVDRRVRARVVQPRGVRELRRALSPWLENVVPS